MAKSKKDKLKKLKRKRFWPSVVVFLLFTSVCTGIVILAVDLFSTYIMGTKFTNFYTQATNLSMFVERRIEQGEDIADVVGRLEEYNREPIEMYVTDAWGREAALIGKNRPRLDQVLEWSFGEELFIILPDNTWSYGVQEAADILNLPLARLAGNAFREMSWRDPGRRSLWLQDTILEQSFWMRIPTVTEDYRFYMLCRLQIQRQDIIYAMLLGGIAIVMMLIPLVFLFVNAVANIHMQREVTKLLYMDAVTLGRNWLYFQGAAGKMLGRILNGRKAYAMINLHMERYANYISCYGSRQGEELLECMDSFLRARMGRFELFGHYGSADFGLLFRCEGTNAEAWKAYCHRRLRSLMAELAGLQPERKLHFHAGVCMVPPVAAEKVNRLGRRREVDVDQLFSYANTAQSASHNEAEQIFFFDETMLADQSWELWVENNMDAALAAGEFQVYLQPKYSPADERLVGAEALVRWNSPEKGLIQPSRFIPIFEENGFITKLDDFMIAQVSKLLAEWTVQGKRMVPVSVNVSRAHFALEGLAEHISQLVDSYGPRHELLELEVTESAFFDDKEILISTVKQLKVYGFSISMDDFGAGYSSLNSLKDIPLDVLKLDGEFFRGSDESGRGAVIVEEAIRLARELNMRVVAEGVERREQVDFLACLGCDMIQGFYYAKPMPVEEFEARAARDC